MRKHRHRWVLFSHSLGELTFRCWGKDCQEQRSRKTTKTEQKKLRQQFGSLSTMGKKGGIHYIWHQFQKRFVDLKTDRFKWTGYELMQKVKQWAKKHSSVRITGCDDDHHMGSYLVIVPHEDAHHYFGTSVVFIPQNQQEPSKFFLYRCDLEGLLDVLKYALGLEKKQRPKPPPSYSSTLRLKPKE